MPAPDLLPLPDRLNAAAAAGLAASLRDRRGRDLVLDGTAAGSAGALCLQVLLAAAASWERDGCRLHIADPSPELAASLTLLGIEPHSPLLQPEIER